MAVQARHLSHAFPAIATDDAAAGGSVFLGDEFSRCAPAGVGVRDTTRLRDFPRSDLSGCGYYHRGIEFEFEPRKRARVDADGFVADQLVPLALPPHQAAVTVQAHHAAGVDDDAVACGAPAAAGGPGGLLLSGLYDLHGAEIDALVRLESERMRAALEDARRRHARALLSAAARAASGRLRAAEAALERARRRNAELEDRARQAAAECHAWMGVARSHEAVAAGLRATLDQLVLQTPCPGGAAAAVAEGDAEDAQSCCFEFDAGGDADGNAAASGSRAAVAASSCRACGGGEACVLLLPCRHLCLCRACEPDADACPVCAAAKNASLHVLLVP